MEGQVPTLTKPCITLPSSPRPKSRTSFTHDTPGNEERGDQTRPVNGNEGAIASWFPYACEQWVHMTVTFRVNRCREVRSHKVKKKCLKTISTNIYINKCVHKHKYKPLFLLLPFDTSSGHISH
ncbi:hypothetical protein, unlikely [Trypanosoma brucei gambiense DAL972]|uniref:Uncharacterized protein n=1 Tax=Trypanosoma brucei gambiense (strain MHOM/CI/86/DAL972) TaxID=679716 RepID=C9ZUR5_TRYB9|nr:hypothetical protein, unlikely [Trypanosoma brucei gambiense DAL972]CBH13153.1 hypothetical protein, unlikely [Trypanosoma brucei gambiense DAL972]|eukprot:XP_011775430.1 hypothetical protein, unlikely [Trypanosoma brucei gambiense DAL972]